MRWHMLLAGFLLPLALVYFIGGALYTLDIKGHVSRQDFVIPLDQVFTPDLDWLVRLTTAELTARGLPVPGGEPALRKKNGRYELRWGDLSHAVKVIAEPESGNVSVTFRERSLLTQVMRVHRAEAGTAFKVLAVILALGLILIFASGVQMAMGVPRMRAPVAIAAGCGLVTMGLLFTL